MNNSEAIKRVKFLVRGFFDKFHPPQFKYHTYQRLKKMVKLAQRLTKESDLTEPERTSLIIAVWLHDLAYQQGQSDSAAESDRIAKAYLQEIGLDEDLIDRVSYFILKTVESPENNDASDQIWNDLQYHELGEKNFFKTDENFRKERAFIEEIRITKTDWYNSRYAQLQSASFQTAYMISNAGKQLVENLGKLKIRALQISHQDQKSLTNPHVSKSSSKAETEKGIETLFRVASANNQRLSSMADNKAHILITVNAIILSAVLSLILRKIADQPYLIWPTLMLIAVSLVTMIFAIMSTRPHTFAGTFTRQELEQNSTNLLFFGNFYRVDREFYLSSMFSIMEDRKMLYSNLIDNLYGQGVSLARKYYLLRIAYSIFIYGIVVAVIAFLIAALPRVDM